MSVRRIMGIETEYGIAALDSPEVSVEDLSRQIVRAYGAACQELGYEDDVAWDFSGDEPLHASNPTLFEPDLSDSAIRAMSFLSGVRRPQDVAVLTNLERSWQRGTSKVLRNGARLYVDHAHPEYAAPEASSPWGAVRFDRAGESVMRRAMAYAAAEDGPSPVIFKNNVDGKGAAYGCHENYLTERRVPFADLVEVLVPFLVTRPVLVGAGRVGLGPASEDPGFQISQRADYLETVVGPHTTYQRPIVNTRDEPHAEPRDYRRLHVINGDANCAPASTLLKLGTTALVLWILENHGVPDEWRALRFADPLAAARTVSRDLTMQAPLELADGRALTSLQIQRIFHDGVHRRVVKEAPRMGGHSPDVETLDMMERWSDTIALLSQGWARAVGTVEWATMLALLDARRRRDGLGWDAPSLAAMDLQWAEIRPERSLTKRLLERGILEAVTPAEWVDAAEFEPPARTRAWFRGELIRRFPNQVYSASWHSIVVEPAPDRMVRIPMTEPSGGTRAQFAAILDSCRSLSELVNALTPRPRDVHEQIGDPT